jgi:hypothetical protein
MLRNDWIQPCSRRLGRALATALAIGLGAGAAHALPVTIGAGGPSPLQVDPLYFIAPSPAEPNPFGLVGPGNGVDYDIGANDLGISACGVGGGCELSITTSLHTPVRQNPQNPAQSENPQTPQGAPTTAVPFVADSTWTVQNTSGGALDNVFLLFTSVDFSGGYPNVDVALDQNLYQIFGLSDGEDESFFGALFVGHLDANASAMITVRYIVAGNLPAQVGGTLVMPPFGLTGLLAMPEPTSVVLLGLGLAGLAVARKRRCE